MSLGCSRLPHVTTVVGSPRVKVSSGSFWSLRLPHVTVVDGSLSVMVSTGCSPRLFHVVVVDGGPSSMALAGAPKTRSRFLPQVITVEGCVRPTVLGGVGSSRLPQVVSLEGLARTGAESPKLTVCGCYRISKSNEAMCCTV
jgi:hypothetical protein